jgi:alginate O-acetyltransferase complex protein AlgJ
MMCNITSIVHLCIVGTQRKESVMIFKKPASFAGAILLAATVSVILTATDARATDETVITKFNASYKRTESRVMMRIIARPTRARLDFAAYDRNPLFHLPNPPRLTPPKAKPKLDDLDFGGSLVSSSLSDRIEGTPLSAQDIASPMAWRPMLDLLADWDYDKSVELMVIGINVSEEKWGNTEIARPLQQITTAYIRAEKGEIWVKVEFEPYVRFLEGVDDEDDDGYAEFYGCISKSNYSPELLDHLRSDYLAAVLTPEQVNDYFYGLSANWYEAFKTETLDMEANRPWPNSETEPEVARELAGLTIENATAIIRGKPFGSPVYNVFVVKTGNSGDPSGKSRGGENPGTSGVQGNPDSAKTGNMAANVKRWQGELQKWGNGSWDEWAARVADFRGDIQRQLKERPASIKGLIGRDGFLFFRGSLNYLTSGELRQQENNRNPYPAIVDYQKQLRAKGIDLLFVIVPTKAEILPDKISDSAPKPDGPYVTPYTRKLMLELTEACVEVVDLLPAFIEAREGDEPIYMKQDTHWTDRGLRLAARIIADRIKQYPWFGQVCDRPISYTVREVTFTRGGDIRGMLPDEEKIAYRPMKLSGQQVLKPDGSFYEDDKSSPIVVMGDSFCGVYQREEPKHAGISAHIAKEIGMPVDLIMAYGSGPGIRKRLARRGASAISEKKLVIWMTAARDLYDYWAPWELIRVP